MKSNGEEPVKNQRGWTTRSNGAATLGAVVVEGADMLRWVRRVARIALAALEFAAVLGLIV
jgi:hypothetical protein